jgi:DNA repair photolyase
LVVRDIDVLREVAAHNSLFVNLTITTLSTKLARILEPRAPRPDLRLQALSRLIDSGLNAGVICAPVLPDITDSPAALDKLVRATKEAGGTYIYANPLFLKPCSANIFLPFLEKEFPHLVDDYRKRYHGKAFVSKAYSKRLSELMAALRKKHGIKKEIQDRNAVSGEYRAEDAQLGLFES